jgi:1-acyl-sn-glycerol-3-phosphate acyltransferase
MTFAVAVIVPLSRLLTKRVWRGQDRIPRRGGVIVAANHLSWVDPMTFAHFVHAAGRLPRFMAKESLFRVPLLGAILRGAGQIPVHRGEREGAAALRDAVQALRNGECIVIYPEGTITRDPHDWPMLAKTGVARLALMSGAPIVPVAQWGAQDILGSNRTLHLIPRRTIEISALEPMQVAPLADGAQPTREQLRSLTDEVMKRIRDEVSMIRGEDPPAELWDPRGDPDQARDQAPDQGADQPVDRGAA